MTTHSAARIGETRDWPLAESYEEVGLGYEELSRVLVDLPAAWDEDMALELARATHAAVSGLIGSMGAGRSSVPAALRALAGMCAVEIVRELPRDQVPSKDEEARFVVEQSPWPEWADAATQALLRHSACAGWGSSVGPWRRIAGLTFEHAFG